MTPTLRRPAGKRCSRAFVPDSGMRSGYDRLERRDLTAPLVFRRPVGFPTPPDNVYVAAAGSINNGVAGAVVFGSASNNGLSLLAQSNSAVVDTANPGAPFAPMGTANVSFSAAGQFNVTDDGRGGFLPGGAQTVIDRDYRLADSVGATTVAYARQTYTYDGSVSGITVGWLRGTLAAPGMAIGVVGGGVTVNGTSLPAGTSSGTFTAGGQTFTYTASLAWNDINIRVVNVQNLGALAASGYTTGGDAVGLPWTVKLTQDVGGTSAGAAYGSATSTYSLELFDSPPV